VSPIPSERRIVFLIGAIQFVNILDFVMVMPLGPDFAQALGIPSSTIGYIGGSYTAAAAVSGLAGSFFLERFDRRKAMAVAMLGLVIGTAAGGFATGLYSLMAARVLAGVFGGPATSLAFSVIADVVPPQRRGKAMGAVMGAFSVASVLGVPAGLELARLGGWRVPFFVVAGIGLAVGIGAYASLPPLRKHLENPIPVGLRSLTRLLSRPLVQVSYLMTSAVMASGFILIPNIAAFVQLNLGYPRDRMGLLYGVGGAVSFFSMRLVGRLVDRFGAFPIGTVGALLLSVVVAVGFYLAPPWMPVLAIFVFFMIAMSFRNVSYNTLTSKVPGPSERAAFMSLQSAVQHLASAIGAFVSAKLLTEENGKLVGIPRLAVISILLSCALPPLLWWFERQVRAGTPPPVAVEPGTGISGGAPRSHRA
jgi:predicted MFS family arabinose efflux permease